jgi:predicted RNA-binding Zn ribbon-like protein
MKDWLKKLATKLGLSAEDIAELGDPEDEGEAQANADEGKPETDELTKLRATVAEQDKRIGELTTAMATANADHRRERVQALVDARVAKGVVKPADREQVLAIAVHLDSAPAVKTNAADGKPAGEKPALETYLAQLDASAVKVNTGARGLSWSGSEDPNAEEEVSEAELDKIVAAVK